MLHAFAVTMASAQPNVLVVDEEAGQRKRAMDPMLDHNAAILELLNGEASVVSRPNAGPEGPRHKCIEPIRSYRLRVDVAARVVPIPAPSPIEAALIRYSGLSGLSRDLSQVRRTQSCH